MTVTSIEESVQGRYTVKFDDGREVTSNLSAVTDARLFSGRELSDEEFSAFKALSGKALYFDKAVALVSSRQLSAFELKKKLMEKGAEAEIAEECVSRLTELGLLNDESYALSLARHCVSRGYGVQRLKSELLRRGISRELWNEALCLVEDSDDSIDSLIRRKLRNPGDRDELRKLSASLYRRGYTAAQIHSALQRFDVEAENIEE